jgi:hypothetical protein
VEDQGNQQSTPEWQLSTRQNNGTADIAYLRNIEKIIAKFPEESQLGMETEIPAPLAESIIGSAEDVSNYLGRLRRGSSSLHFGMVH